DGGRAEILVDAREEHDVVLTEQIRVALEREIEPAERRAAVAGDQGRGVEPAALIGAVLVERQPHQRLNAREEDLTFLLAVFGVQSEITLDRHGSPLEVTERMIRGAQGDAQMPAATTSNSNDCSTKSNSDGIRTSRGARVRGGGAGPRPPHAASMLSEQPARATVRAPRDEPRAEASRRALDT